jgi:kinesin family protein 4/21/27
MVDPISIHKPPLNSSPVFECEKGQEVFSMHVIEQTKELFWGTRTHNVRYATLSPDGRVEQLDPPHYDRVTGVGVVENYILSW